MRGYQETFHHEAMKHVTGFDITPVALFVCDSRVTSVTDDQMKK